jgi:hypothetical protein
MNESQPSPSATTASMGNLQARVPSDWVSGKQYIPIGGITNVNGGNEPALNQYKDAPATGIWVLGSKNGNIQWIETEDC